MNKPIHVFGDSNALGHQVPPNQGYPSVLAASLGVSKTVSATNGFQASDGSGSYSYGISPSDAVDYLIMLGTNDAHHYGPSAVKREAAMAFLRNLAVACVAPNRVTGRVAVQARDSGQWYNTPVNTIGAYTDQPGATATASVSGSAVFVSYILQNHAPSESKFEIYVDGVLKKTVELQGTQVGNTVTGRSYSPACVCVCGLSDGPHTVQVKSISTNRLFLDWIAGSDQPIRPNLFIADVMRKAAAGYAGTSNSDAIVADYTAAIADLVEQLSDAGFYARIVKVHDGVDPAIHYQADGTHLNVAGHIHVASIFEATITGVAPPEEPTDPGDVPFNGSVAYAYAAGGTIALDFVEGEVVRMVLE